MTVTYISRLKLINSQNLLDTGAGSRKGTTTEYFLKIYI